ncbi:hypothetical protein FQN54_006073 [Arachnomyces sp. PD_36]|nr:hypothetical protein FQN54_006073 [Arachnomyces sp. PD_36]
MTASEELNYARLGDPALLRKIDQLFACNVGNHIDLPQLVVVGDQSSGKSSVLEGLTRLPFPRDSGLCTRFATHITFRRDPERSIAVSIIPAADASQEEVERMRAWSVTIETLDATSFGDIMAQVHGVMDLSDPQAKDSGKEAFSDNVLRLEISGPDQDHLSVIDVPGIFKTTTEGVTTKSDMALVERIVKDYMKNPRSVMLAVVPANVDPATQGIIEMAKEYDPEGYRTLGVLTKPDLVEKGAEQGVVDFIDGKKPGYHVQWSVVRNPGKKDLESQLTDRQLEADFFRNEWPWNTIEKDRVGIDGLRIRLQEVITDHTRREFPKVKLEINKRLKEAKESLNSLGIERDTALKQRKFILDIVTKFQSVVHDALATNYGANDLFEKQTDLRLPTKLMDRNEKFSDQMQKWGQQYWFSTKASVEGNNGDENVTEPEPTPEDSEGILEETGGYKIDQADQADQADQLDVRAFPSSLDVEEILHDQEAISRPSGNILGWLEAEHRNNRGFELGTVNSSLLPTIMKTQSTKWTALAMGYISDVVVIVHKFILQLLQSVCTDARVRTNVISIIGDDLFDRYKLAIEHVVFLLNVERVGTHMTENHYFNDNLEKCRRERLRAAVADKSPEGCKHGQVVRLDDLMQHHPMSNRKHVVLTIHDILMAYYKVARKRFVDNVCLQAAAHHLITGPTSPLKLLSSEYVLDLTEDQLEAIAGEDAGLKRKRKQLNKEIKDLEAGRRILM